MHQVQVIFKNLNEPMEVDKGKAPGAGQNTSKSSHSLPIEYPLKQEYSCLFDHAWSTNI